MEKSHVTNFYAAPVVKILDWYILKKFLSTYLFVVLILVGVICMIDFTDKSDDFIRNDLTAGFVISEYYLYFIPYIANLITPITVFISVVFLTSRLAAHTEIIAILSSGVSFIRFMVPYMIGAGIIAALTFGMMAYIIPPATKKKVDFELKYVKKKYYFSDQNLHIKIAPDRYLHIKSYSNSQKKAYKANFEHIEGNQLLSKLDAETMDWITEDSVWRLRNWKLREIKGMDEILTSGAEKDTVLAISPVDFENKDYFQETLTLPELNEYITVLEDRGADDILTYRVQKYILFMSPFAVLILTFIGLIVSSKKSRGGSGLQIAIGFLMAFVYLIFFIFSKAVAEANSVNPILAVWMPNITFTVIGLVMYKLVPR